MVLFLVGQTTQKTCRRTQKCDTVIAQWARIPSSIVKDQAARASRIKIRPRRFQVKVFGRQKKKKSAKLLG
jgi:hypothetical protein